MRTYNRTPSLVLSLFALAIVCCSFIRAVSYADNKLNMPYKAAGLTKEEAAAHLLSRFTYGARVGEVEEVVKTGLDKWLKGQLEGDAKDEELNGLLTSYDAINLTNKQAEDVFPQPARINRMAISEGYVNKDSVNNGNSKYQRDAVANFMKDKGYRPQAELFRQLINQKILRATYTKNQFREIMTDFWFNHFNVALNKNQCAIFVPAYERDVIRPNVFGNFDQLLLKTAKSPAMLMYLDNFSSSGINVPVPGADNANMMGIGQQQKVKENIQKRFLQARQQRKGNGGLNENYAREVMELHTLGVDGGYTQNDVTEAARILTGWTVAPMGNGGYGSATQKIIDRVGENNLRNKGYVLDGDFFFAINRHDSGEKMVLGKKFEAGGGYEEGEALLEMLAHHKSTANFISKKIATRFVNDNPPQSLIDKMAKTFLSKNGNIKDVIITMVNSPEFWSKEALREKTKSPFELAISTARSLNADISQPYQLYTWINRMGQQMYYYQAPTGFPDRGQYWINTGSLLNRMNFGLAFASQKIPGVNINLLALNDNHEPESAVSALETYSKLIMPERDLDKTIDRLKPMLNDPELQQKVADAAAKNNQNNQNNSVVMQNGNTTDNEKMKPGKGKKAIENPVVKQQAGNSTMLAQVVGVIIGSPEFQRK